MDYKKAYDEKWSKAKTLHKLAVETNNDNTRMALEELYPEFKESEGEVIRKALIELSEKVAQQQFFVNRNTTLKDVLAWLEKQGEQPNKVSIWKHWTNGIGGNGDGRQVFLIKRNGTYDVTSCLSNECDYIELSELDKLSSPNWKPSREQLMALIHAIGKAKEEAFSVDGDRLQSLYNDLTRHDTRNISKDLN